VSQKVKNCDTLVDVIFEQPYCRISNVVDKKVAQRQAASRHLKDLVSI
jgi:predicted transcriptional regulator